MTAPRLGGHARLLAHHVDGLELTCSVLQLPLLMQGELESDALDLQLAALQHVGRSYTPQAPVESQWNWDGRPVVVHPSGLRRGSRYCISTSDWMLFITAARAVSPRFTMQARSDYLLATGPLHAFDSMTTWVEQELLPLVGGRPPEDEPVWRIARLDLAADVLGVNLGLSSLRRFTTRANSRRSYSAGQAE